MNIFNFFKGKNLNGITGLNARNLQLIYPNNERKYYKMADNKVLSKKLLHKHDIPCAVTYAVIERMSDIKKKWKACKKYDAMAVKPANGSGGEGIKIIRKNEDGQWISSGRIIKEEEIIRHMSAILSGLFSLGANDCVLIEECIIPHPFFAEIYPEGVPDFRVITLKGNPIMGMLRMPTARSEGKANLHQKGVGIGIDMKKGILTQVYDGKKYSDHHPDNPNIVFGKPIPYWNEIIEIAIATSKVFPLDYLGIDIVIDKNKGPQIMEVNVRPGLGIQLVNRQGLHKVIADLKKNNTRG
ncbi:alpha-L-glutamate ligase-like protein [Flavobacteriaceae bacterium R38]|nr:alpha-L-glutamate ligase-like protein [Flavobacteriaceae bacterium R38]